MKASSGSALTSAARHLRLTAAVVAVLAIALAAATATAAAAAMSPAPTISPTDTTSLWTTVRPATVHRGDTATIVYRADGTAGGEVTLELLITTRGGELVRRLVSGRTVPVGEAQTWSGRVTLRRGSYVLVVHARDAAGRSEILAQPATLRVRRALPPLTPTARARRAAFHWAAGRSGRVTVAVVDSRGRLYGHNTWRPFTSASVVKAMLLVAYLRSHDSVSAGMRATLASMITTSDNDCADVVFRLVGTRGLTRLAKKAHMRGFHASGAWITTRLTAGDMARFFRDMESYLPAKHRRFANSLLSGVVDYQCWGIPAAARPLGYRVYFKPGWLGSWTLANEAARLERGKLRIGLAVFTDQNPSATYGKDTIAGVTARLLKR